MTRSVICVLAAAVSFWSPLPGFAQVKLDPPVKPAVTGTYTANGKPAQLQYITVLEREPFNDKEGVTLIFTEKDPKNSKKPSIDAMFNKLGSALILNVFQADGDIFGCEVAHSALTKGAFSAIGPVKMSQFSFTGGNISGRIATKGVIETFGNQWQLDLTFAAPLPEKLRATLSAPPKPAETAGNKKSANDDEEKPAAPAKPAGPLPLARDLPLPADAKQVQFKGAVKQIQCASALPVSAVTKDLSARLKAQGWNEASGGLQGPNNAILRREKNGAKLTVMIQPAGTGSTVKIFADGVDWTGAETPASQTNSQPAAPGSDIEGAAQKMIQDALKGL